MSQRQSDMLEHLDELVAYFLKAGTVNQESLGRAGEKLNKLSLLAFNLPEASKSLSFGDLDSFLSILHSQFNSYSNPKRDRKNPRPEPEPSHDNGGVPGCDGVKQFNASSS